MQHTKEISYSRAYFLFSFNSAEAIRPGIGVLVHCSPKRMRRGESTFLRASSYPVKKTHQGLCRTWAESQSCMVFRYSGSIAPVASRVTSRISWSTFGNTRIVKSRCLSSAKTRWMTATHSSTGINWSCSPNKKSAGTRGARRQVPGHRQPLA